MKFPRWAIPVVIRLLSLAGMTSAGGGETRALAIGFALSTAQSPTSSTSSSQPLDDLSLDLNFFVQVADHEIKVPFMPLHLLPKKSWNVYNTENVSRVRRDEAAAQALEEAEEQRLQEQDAARRMAILRGEIPPPLAIEEVPSSPASQIQSERKRDREGGDDEFSRRMKKPRKRYGEDETDYEMRLAAQDAASKDGGRQLVLHKDSSNAPITDNRGHISLFPPSAKEGKGKVEKNAEVEAEKKRKEKEYEDQFTMRFANAKGFRNDIGGKAWYEDPGKSLGRDDGVGEEEDSVVGKDVWGNEDPRRRDREAKRVVDNDPLAFMKRGARMVREVERERKAWRVEKEREIRELEDAERRSRRRKRKEGEKGRNDGSEDDLEGFRLDGDVEDDRSKAERRERRRAREEAEGRRRRSGHHRRSEHSHGHRERSRESYRARGEEEGRGHGHSYRRRHD